MVDAHGEALRSRLVGLSISNRDQVNVLAIHGRRRILVEVKTDSGTSSVYGGVGQLTVYGIATRPTERCLVLPSEGAAVWKPQVARIGVHVVSYHGRGSSISIDAAPA